MYRLDLEEMYDYYRKNVSGGNYPISLPLARYLNDLCWKIKPTKILDRGTGFSSYVFRKYALESWRWPKVFSVDSNEGWLNKTVDFLRYCELKTEHLYLWSYFKTLPAYEWKFDIILEDYTILTRVKSLHIMVNMLDKNGYLILDDADHERYTGPIFRAVKRFNLNKSYLFGGKVAILRKR